MFLFVSHSKVTLCLEAAILFSATPHPYSVGKPKKHIDSPRWTSLIVLLVSYMRRVDICLCLSRKKFMEQQAYVRGLGTCVNSSCKGGWTTETQHFCSGYRSNLISVSPLCK